MRAAGAALGLLATSCAPPPQLPPSPLHALEGEWRVVSVNGRQSPGTATIAPPLFKIDFGCNAGRGDYRLNSSNLLVVVPLAVTERGCVTPDGRPTEAAMREEEGFRIVARAMRVRWYGPDYVRLTSEMGSVDLAR